MTVENFVRIVWTVFEKIEKVEKWLFFGHFWANFGYVSHIPAILFWCLCTRRGPFGCRMTVQNFVKIVWTVFEKFEIFMKSSGEKKQHDCISNRKFFPTPKKPKNFFVCHNLEKFSKFPNQCFFHYFCGSRNNDKISTIQLFFQFNFRRDFEYLLKNLDNLFDSEW